MSEFYQEPQSPSQPPYSEPTPPYNNGSFNNTPQEPRPNNNLVLAIVSTVLGFCTCCGYGGCLGLILGIIAIVFASQVDSKYNMGDVFGAQKAASNAKLLSYIALATVAVSIIIIIVRLATADTAAIMEQYRELLEQYQ